MLEMREKCERCGRDLPSTSQEAMICSFECTFCSHCSTNDLKEVSELRGRTGKATDSGAKARLRNRLAGGRKFSKYALVWLRKR